MSTATQFKDRLSAGEQLGEKIVMEMTQLRLEEIWASPIVYALPRGGVSVAVPLAQQLNCALEVVVAKKISLPENPELAVGALTNEGQVLWTYSQSLKEQTPQQLKAAQYEAERRAASQHQLFADFDLKINPQGAIAILVDDGIATGMTMAVAIQTLRTYSPAQIWLCAPVAPRELIDKLRSWCDRLIILETPHPFHSVSRFYEKFDQVEDEQALAYLEEHRQYLESSF
ncbi:MAG: phosphoribosyltransferase family protein [Spirulinaceae cyanobacterium]